MIYAQAVFYVEMIRQHFTCVWVVTIPSPKGASTVALKLIRMTAKITSRRKQDYDFRWTSAKATWTGSFRTV